MKIKVTYTSIDRVRKVRTFKTIEAAKAFAVQWVGKYPEMGSTYAVSGDGVGKIEVEGCTLKELFAEPKTPAQAEKEKPLWIVAGRQFETWEAARAESLSLMAEGYGVRAKVDDEFMSAYPVEGPFFYSEIYGENEP